MEKNDTKSLLKPYFLNPSLSVTVAVLLMILSLFSVEAREMKKMRETIDPFDRMVIQQSVSGTVTDENGQPLPGANILEKGTTNGVIADFDGNFTLKVAKGDAMLVFSYIGFATKEVALNGQSNITVALTESATGLDEIVLIGFGSMKKSDLTGSVTRVEGDELSQRPNVSLSESLRGAVAGLNIGQVNQAGGEPSMSIRGKTSISGAQTPLIVLDGAIFRGNIIDINMNDVEAVDVLKDATAAAVYGSQSANGVIIISTKKGDISDKPLINYSTSYSFQKPSVEFKPETSEDYLERVVAGYFLDSRTEESGYLDPNPNFNINSIFRTNDKIWA